MEDSDDSDAKLREEIEAELDKISVSSLEINEAESDSESETQSDNSDTDIIELPESVLHCISVIKNKSKTAEELILQDLEEDIDVSSCSSGTVPNSHRHLRIGSSMESKANSEQLMKILSAIEKEEFMRSLTHSAKSDSVPEPATLDTPMDECILSDDADLSFEYFEVEERCRKSFEAWQDKQKELEEKDKETLEVQSDIEKQKFQEEDEKRHFWIKQFEVEKKKLENLQKQDQDMMNDELYKEEKIWKEKYREHEELIRNMHLQMEEERTRLCELQEKEKARLLNLQHNAAVKIQAKYKALVTYRKYSPIIKEQIENKKRKAQEQKEREAKIRQKEEERRRRIKEEQKMEEERKKKMLEERRRREREYEEKKSLLRREREEQRNKEKMRQSEDAHKLLTINCTFKKGKCHGKQQAAANKSQSKADIAEELVDTNSEKTEDACLVQQSNKRENVHTQHKQLTLKESIGVKLTPNQAILAELKINENLPKLKVNENSENLSKKQCLEKLANQEIDFKNTDQREEWKNSDLKETQECQRHELKPQNHKEETVMYDTQENAGQKNQKMFAFNQEMSEEDKNERQEIKGNQERLVEKIKKMEITQQESPLYGENNTSSVSTQKDPPSLILENPECAERNVILEDKEIDVKSKRIEELSEDSVLTGDAVVLNSDASVITGGKTDQQGPTEGKTDQKGPTEGRTDHQGPTEGKTEQKGPTEGRTDHQGPTEGRTDQQGPTEGRTEQQGPTEGKTEQQGPTEGKIDQQGPTEGKTDQQGLTEGRTDQKGPTEGRTEQQGPTEGRTEQQGPTEGKTDQQGPTEGRTDQKGPTEGRTDQQGPTEGRTDQKSPTEGRTDQQGPTESRTEHHGPTEGKTDQQGPTEGRTDQQGSTESRTDQQGPVSGILASSSEAGSHSANSHLLTEEGEDTPKCESRENLEQWEPKKSESDSALACSVSQRAVLSSVEERRLAWIKSSKPWSEIFEQNQLKKIIKKKRLVKCPANTMPPLDSSAILQHGPWDTLQQVKDITFQDLPGCSLSTLADYSNLQLLCLRRCGLTSLHSLSHCKNLKYIDVQENHIETINCENLENLCVVLLNKNLLTSIHGFDGCTNIQSLELSHNKITRISGLESLKYLQQLTVDHNQLISTKGLCEAPTIIYLDCSHNHLTDVDGIGNCGLLQIIKLQGNYLREPPSLRNHVLLRELHLDDNSISNMEVLSSCWLPLLQALSISQNSLTTIVPLFHFVSLEKLDVRNNCLSDLTSIMCWFNACYSLRELALTGNPVLQEINWRDSVLNTLPALRILNGDMLNSCSDIHIEEHCHQDLRCFLALCQSQLQEFSLLTDKYITQKGDSLTLHAADKLSHYYKNLMKLSNECRCAHEHGAVNIMKRAEPEVEKKNPAFSNTDSMLQNEVFHSWTDNYKPDSPDSSENLTGSGSRPSPLNQEELEERNQETLMAQQNECSRTNSLSTRRASFIETKMGNSLMSSHRHAEQSEPVKAAVLIQAQWRRHIARRQINCSAKMHPTAREPLHNPFLSNRTTSNKGRRENFMNSREQREKAALQIQAVWKGFILRKKLLSALEAIRNEESGEEYEEIDLEEFAFDEGVLEKDWPALDSTSFPSQTLPLSNQLPWPKTSRTLRHDEPSLPVPARPAPAWLSSEKETVFSPTHTQLSSSRSENRTLSWTTESKTSRKSLLQSEKEEKISEEWGFKDISTAQQMLKRAQKMKSKKLKKNLEPSVRLALFKKTRNKVPVTKSSKKTQLRRDGYFEGIEAQALRMLDEEEDALSKATTASEKLERSKEYTYQWLHTQVGFPEATSSRNLKCHHFLPELDPDVLNGGRVQLVARLVSREDTDLDLFSTTSGSALSVNKEKKSQSHRFSTGSSSGSSKGIIAPVITNTRPCVKERISFRDNPLQLSGGWGSGKKKAKFST